MKQKVIATMMVALVLLATGQPLLMGGQHEGHGGGVAGPMPTREFVKTGKKSGKVVSLDESSITIEVQKKGQAETLFFLMTDQTKTKGEIGVGTEVKIKYREQMGQRMATNIEVGKTKGQTR